MSQLPESYVAYLAGRNEDDQMALRPILLQSSADRKHGVRVVDHAHGLQARIDDTIPFGTVVEDVD
ncbi:hypothetical protein [Specibacter cremeus]|uniref:hypothetical protein n=1 Tax=Specibacter cremeus TaxID=1629051 RepID=UPI000F76AF69|nr:hypothetical protein [Specibacter cremeus]